mgnify:CR=1 FL=1
MPTTHFFYLIVIVVMMIINDNFFILFSFVSPLNQFDALPHNHFVYV